MGSFWDIIHVRYVISWHCDYTLLKRYTQIIHYFHTDIINFTTLLGSPNTPLLTISVQLFVLCLRLVLVSWEREEGEG